MSQQHREEPGHNRRNMAVSYSSNIAPSRNQTLPSFRELLPPHLHDEIDQAAYYAQSSTGPEAASFSKSRQQQQQQQQHPQQHPQHQHRGQALPPPGTPTAGTVYPSRGPSPILPPLRDLQSAPPGRHLDRPMSAYDAAPRSGPESVYGGGRSSMEDDRFRAAPPYSGPAGGNGGAPSAMYNQSQTKGYGGHPYHAPSYASESEYSTLTQTHNHPLPASTFGVIGEPMDSRGKRRRGNLPKPVTDILRAWFHDHLDHPYPTEEDKQIFMSRTGLSISQISNWFINARRRQLPALRNQIRNSDDHRSGSPMSDDLGVSSPGSTASPTRPRHG